MHDVAIALHGFTRTKGKEDVVVFVDFEFQSETVRVFLSTDEAVPRVGQSFMLGVSFTGWMNHFDQSHFLDLGEPDRGLWYEYQIPRVEGI